MEGFGEPAGQGVERPAALLALIVIPTFAPLTSGLLPAIVASLVNGRTLTAEGAGHVSALYSLAGVCAGLLAGLWLRRADRRRMLAVLVVLGFCADLCAVWLRDYATIAAGRFVTGFAASSVLIAVNATIAASSRRERIFGIVLTSQSLAAAALFFTLSHLSLDTSQLFAILAAGWLVTAPFVIWIPEGPSKEARWEVRGPRIRRPSLTRASVVLLAVGFLSFEVATGALWTYLFTIGQWHGLSVATVGSAIALGMLAAIPGGLIVALIGRRFGHSGPLILGLVANVAFTAILLWPIGGAAYALSVSATSLLYTFALALFLTLLGDEDPSGSLFPLANVIIFGGMALGAWLLSSSVDSGNYRTLLEATVAAFAAAPAFILLRQGLVRLRRSALNSRKPGIDDA